MHARAPRELFQDALTLVLPDAAVGVTRHCWQTVKTRHEEIEVAVRGLHDFRGALPQHLVEAPIEVVVGCIGARRHDKAEIEREKHNGSYHGGVSHKLHALLICEAPPM